MISGFIILKNVLVAGYPFVEAIASALPVCDEFLISEGYSTDGTYEVVQKIAKLNKKVKVLRQNWSNKKTMTVLAEVTNAVRQNCKYNYILSVQANEVIHEQSVEYLKALPEMCPKVRAFCLPFLELLWNYKFFEQFRLRFAQNLPEIVAIGDAWALGPSKAFTRSAVLKGLKNPRLLLRYVARGVEWTYANSFGNTSSIAAYLPKPIFRYWSIFPLNYFEKCQKHKEMFGLQEFSRNINVLKNHLDDDPDSFWRIAAEMFRKGQHGFNYPEGLGVIKTEDHPRLMQGLISDSKTRKYHVREELFDLIKAS